ncbi:nuclear transport factor 2 family protein [Clostridium estertheticum]|uniref:nuclear transport factor 2 family protein n=1 Tax=Clostridium estertheticum TaxID=238834 RepID=UPI001C0C8DCB|nr:nuclear transport factor 2 family protein [Clostridium estertheticum]MBU3178628.1 nuclear transport factor 2 family protein [Clostridium estertheticum]
MNEQYINEIKLVIYKFLDGYQKRDLNEIDNFMKDLFCQEEDTLVFGAAPNEEFVGYKQVRTLIEKDWKYWGDLSLDIDGAVIHVGQDMACVTMRGKVKMQINESQLCGRSLHDIGEMIGYQLSTKERLLMICDNASKVLLELERGENHIWSIRITSVLVKHNSKWLFKQIHFSHPTMAYPGERIID